MASREALEAKKVTELKEECTNLGLPVTGKKAELIDRILAALGGAPDPAEAPAAEPAVAAAANGGGADAAAPGGKHQRIEFSLPTPEPAAPEAKIIKLAEEPAPAAAPAAAEAPEPAAKPAGDLEAVAVLSAADRKKLRGEKFGMSDDDKKKKRAERFGLAASSDDEEKKLKRRQRFGNTTKDDEKAALLAKKAELMDPEKLKARAERFGAVKPLVGLSDTDKKKARAARFGAQ